MTNTSDSLGRIGILLVADFVCVSFFVIGGECCQEREKVAFDDAKVALNDIATGQSPSREMGFSEKWGIPFIVDFPIKNGDFP